MLVQQHRRLDRRLGLRRPSRLGHRLRLQLRAVRLVRRRARPHDGRPPALALDAPRVLQFRLRVHAPLLGGRKLLELVEEREVLDELGVARRVAQVLVPRAPLAVLEHADATLDVVRREGQRGGLASLQLSGVGVAPARLQDRRVLAQLLARRLAARLEHHFDERRGLVVAAQRLRDADLVDRRRDGPLVEERGDAVEQRQRVGRPAVEPRRRCLRVRRHVEVVGHAVDGAHPLEVDGLAQHGLGAHAGPHGLRAAAGEHLGAQLPRRRLDRLLLLQERLDLVPLAVDDARRHVVDAVPRAADRRQVAERRRREVVLLHRPAAERDGLGVALVGALGQQLASGADELVHGAGGHLDEALAALPNLGWGHAARGHAGPRGVHHEGTKATRSARANGRGGRCIH